MDARFYMGERGSHRALKIKAMLSKIAVKHQNRAPAPPDYICISPQAFCTL